MFESWKYFITMFYDLEVGRGCRFIWFFADMVHTTVLCSKRKRPMRDESFGRFPIQEQY